MSPTALASVPLGVGEVVSSGSLVIAIPLAMLAGLILPLGDWVRAWTDGTRNNYDKLGHFAQGFVPAMIARELFLRLGVVNGAGWRAFLIVAFCLGFSAFYELIEWWVALLSNEAAEAFLGTQGYAWDTQSDMAWAGFGAVLALATLGRWHDRQLAALSR